MAFDRGVLFTSGVSLKTTGMFFWLRNLCLTPFGGHSFVTCLVLSMCQQTFHGMLPSSDDFLSRYVLLFSFDLGYRWLQSKSRNSKAQVSFYSFPLQVLTVRVQEKEGRARILGRRDPVLAAHAAGMKRKINPSFPNSQTIPKLEQNNNH